MAGRKTGVYAIVPQINFTLEPTTKHPYIEQARNMEVNRKFFGNDLNTKLNRIQT